MIEDVALIALTIVVFGAGLLVARLVGRRLLEWSARVRNGVDHRGTVYGSDMIVRVALIGVWAGGALGSLGVLPGIVWLATGDTEARRIAVAIVGVSGMVVVLAVLMVIVGMRFFVLEEDRITRVGAFGERSVRFAAIDRFDESGGLPALRIHSDAKTMRVSKTLAGFDDLFNRITEHVSAPYVVPEQVRPGEPTEYSLQETAQFAVSAQRRRVNTVVLISTLVVVLVWPWFLVEGDHVVRDSFIFMAMGLGLWLVTVLLVRTETSPRGQPIELRLAPSEIGWRLSRGEWQTRRPQELVSASVETTIIYVKSQPGHRYPLRLRFTDGTVLQIDDHRGRHLGSSTQLLGLELRRRYVTTANRLESDLANATAQLLEARAAENRGDVLAAVGAYQRAIAHWPDEAHLALHRYCGDLLRAHVDSLVGDGREFRKETAAIRADALGHYRAHLDTFPYDADAWQAIAACVGGGSRTDLADESIASAEQLLMSGRHTPTEHLRTQHGPN